MFDAEKDHALALDQIEHQIVPHDEFPKSLGILKAGPHFLHEGSRFSRSNGVGEKCPSGLGEPAEGWDDVVEQAIEEAGEGGRPFPAKKGLKSSEIGREIL